MTSLVAQGKPKIVLGVSGASTGSVAAIKVPEICDLLHNVAEVRVVSTRSGLHFLKQLSLPGDVLVHQDESEWHDWSVVGDPVLHIELRKWADLMVIAPLSANTLAKVANGMCDNLLTCIVRAWDFSKPLLVAPAMNTFMWDSPFTGKHLKVLKELGVTIVPPVGKKLACGDVGVGAMAAPADIYLACTKVLQQVNNDE